MAYMFVPRRRARLPGARHGAPAVGRRLGRGHPPADRRGDAHAAGDDAAVPADRARHAATSTTWTHADVVAHDEMLQHKQLYLNTPFFLVRAAIYFAVWNGWPTSSTAGRCEQDRTRRRELARRMQMLSGGGLLAYGLTITFASFDWLMSLEPHWFSTIYGVLIMGGQGLSALAFLIVVLVLAQPPARRSTASSSPAHFHDLGNLMLAFVMLWAYFSFSQYLIIWSGNLPEEIAWYLHRLQTRLAVRSASR